MPSVGYPGSFVWAKESGFVAVVFAFLSILAIFVVLAACVYVKHRVFLHCLNDRMEADEERRGRQISVRDVKVQMEPTEVNVSEASGPTDRQTDGLTVLPEHERMGIAWSEVSYWAPSGRRLLRRVTGAINPGECIAVMGPSGSGKTTCLDVLAGRRRTGRFAGRVYINGQNRSEPAAAAYFNANAGYMLQLAEAFAPALTVRENLAYAATLRLPTSMPFEEKMNRVDAVVAELNMTSLMDVPVGGATGGGLSGGQKRKLMLAVELLSWPACLFLDEPTSGLDATSALEVMGTLRRFCATGRSVAVTIHQPRAEIFSAFDKLLLLYNGSVAFLGSPLLGSKFLVQMATTLNDADARFDAHANPADIVLDILNHEGGFDSRKKMRRRKTWTLSRRHSSHGKMPQTSTLDDDQAPQEHITTNNIGRFAVAVFHLSGVQASFQRAINEVVTKAPPLVAPQRPLSERVAHLWTQLWALESRALLNTSNQTYFSVHAQFWALAFLFGSLFYHFEKASFLFSVVYNLPTFGTALWLTVCITNFCEGLQTTYQFEVTAGVVTAGQFVLQMMIHLTFWLLFAQIPYVLIAYCLSFEHFASTPLLYTMCMILFDSQVFQAFFLMCSALAWYSGARSSTTALVIAGSAHALLAFFGGFYIPKQDTPDGWVWAMVISPRFYTTSAIMRMSLQGYTTRSCVPLPTGPDTRCLSDSSGDAVVKRFGYENTSTAAHALVLLCMWLGYSAFTLVLLKMDAAAFSPVGLLSSCKKRIFRAVSEAHREMREMTETGTARAEEQEAEADLLPFKEASGFGQAKRRIGLMFTKPEDVQKLEESEPESLEEPSRAAFRADFGASPEGQEIVNNALKLTQPDDVVVWLPGASPALSTKSSAWKLVRKMKVGAEEKSILAHRKQAQAEVDEFAVAFFRSKIADASAE